MFKSVDPKLDLPKLEEEILLFWDKNKIFEKSIENRKDAKKYTFYDGPPFATGSPHYGHIVASTIKDVVPRYFTMKGYCVERKWGWDCHGLPIENIAEKTLGIKQKKQIEELGIKKFNDTCRAKVLEYAEEWKRVIRRLGRWADMENSYKTMDLSYMESVWWVFSEMYKKGLIYEGYRSIHICPRCETTLSQSEVSEGYKDVKDISVVAKFRLVDEKDTSVLAWTTTPWTLIGNVALAVGEKIDYVKIKISNLKIDEKDQFYILAKDRLDQYFKGDDYKIIEATKGSDLVGKKYIPLFDYYQNISLENAENGYQIVLAEFVTTENGTGVVHIAPAFGEDDMNLGKEKKLPFIQHIGIDGVIKKDNGEFSGLSVKPKEDVKATDKKIVNYLEKNNLLFLREEYEHSYPHCWRCETPLINYATSSWFVAVTKIKNNLLKGAEQIYWFPNHIKSGRFGKWLAGARDWSISRQRYWASTIPIWRCNKCENIKVIGSVSGLEELSNEKIADIHKHIVDNILFKCNKCQGEMKRIQDVLDCWFESGSMPYAELHYPFEGKDKFKDRFPAEFIAEGSDQTRAWFYYLHTISTAIFNKPAYKNVIVNGIVLASDGKKMSKHLNNYPDPMEMFNKYGADAVRYYLLTSPVMSADNLRFSEQDVAKIYRGIFRMIWNTYYFFILYAKIDNYNFEENDKKSNNILDRWIISELNQLIKDVNESMTKYDLVKSTRVFQSFVDNLSNWYIRRSRRRFWKSESDADKQSAYQTLYEVLLTLSKLLAPFTPFIAEEIYTNLSGKISVHFEEYPAHLQELIDEKVSKDMKRARQIVEMGLAERSTSGIQVRQPLTSISYFGEKLDIDLEQIIAEEVNVKKVVFDKSLKSDSILLDTKITNELAGEGRVRELIHATQSLRKKTGFLVEDRIKLSYSTEDQKLQQDIEKHIDIIKKEVLAESITEGRKEAEGECDLNINNNKIWIGVSRNKNV